MDTLKPKPFIKFAVLGTNNKYLYEYEGDGTYYDETEKIEKATLYALEELSHFKERGFPFPLKEIVEIKLETTGNKLVEIDIPNLYS